MKPHKPTRAREGKYANYFEVGHNPFEFYVDFGQYDPQAEKAQMHTRIVTSPAYAKMLGETLNGSVESFEEEHGAIPASAEAIDAMEMVRESLEGPPDNGTQAGAHRGERSRGMESKS